MNSRADNFRNLLIEMYGKTITNRMVDNDLSLKNQGISKSIQKDIKEHLLILENKFDLEILIIYKEWVLDFPGWFGKLNFNNNDPAKKIVIIGQDPHLPRHKSYGQYELYGAYAACDPDEIGKQNVWSIVPYITGLSRNITDTSSKNLIYATDRCYITPKHFSAIEKDKNRSWQNISKIIGGYFIKKQIDILRPNIIISNGSIAYNMLTENDMYVETGQEELFSISNKRPRYIKTAKNIESGIILISIPHLGGRHSNFWKDNETIIKAKEIISSKLN